MSRTIAVADIGGTHARFALAEIEAGRVQTLGGAVTLRTMDHESLGAAWEEFGRFAGAELPDALGMAFGGPVSGEQLRLTNSPWVVHLALLKERFGITQFKLVNDFGAVAHAVAQFDEEQFDQLCGPPGPIPALGVATVIGPGTGLGVAQLLKTSSGYHVIDTEGGHIDFAPLDSIEDRILDHLRRRLDRVSVERIASGGGLANLYNAIAAIEGRAVDLSDEKSIWAAATEGSDPLAVAALDRFFLTLGAVAGDFALAHGAKVVVIAGGLGYRLKHRFAASGFADRFIAKGRFQSRMEAIPVKLLNHPQPGLFGAAAAFAQEFA